MRACGGCGGCGASVPGKTAAPGRGALVSQTLSALLPPIAGFILGYVLAARFLPLIPHGESAGEGFRALAGLAGMLLLALPVYFFRRQRRLRGTVSKN
jgi:hypothetical protein